MKKKHFIATLFLLFLFNIPSFTLCQKRLEEVVKVTAAEIPVRAYLKGQAVKNLSKEDFELFENGIRQNITNFEIISRKISSEQKEGPDKSKKRLFILIFNVFDYNESVEGGIDYFFKNIFREEDELLVLTENRLLNFKRGKNLSEIAINLKKSLKKYKHISMQNTLQTFKNINYEAERLVNTLRGLDTQVTGPSQGLLRYFDNYQRLWLEYKKKYIIPDIEVYRSIIERIKNTKEEKWAICFQQREIFPRLKYGGQLDSQIRDWIGSQADPQGQVWGRLIQTRQMELQKSLDISDDFPANTLKELYVEANITFHMILLKSLRFISSQDFDMMGVSQNIEDHFKKTCLSTGGSFLFLNNPSEALKKVSEKEDYYYLLIYSPKETSTLKKSTIEIKLKKEEVEISYPKYFFKKEIPSITISHFKAEKKTIKFTLMNFDRQHIEDKLLGIAEVNITLFDENSNKVFSEAKTLNLTKKEVHFSINLNKLKSGSYFIIVNTLDKISNKTDTFSGEIEL